MIQEIILKESAKEIFKYATSFLKKNLGKLISQEKDIQNSLIEHVQKTKNWSSEITFKDLKASKDVQQTYIELDMYVYPRNIRMYENEAIQTIPLNKIFSSSKNHFAILGQPGAGKTTSMKYLCQSIFFSENSVELDYKYPILIKLRDFNTPRNIKNDAGIIIEYLFNVFGFSIEIKDSQSEAEIIRTKQKLVHYIIENLNVLLIIDGFDELNYSSHRDIVLGEIVEFANYLEKSKLILTSRTSDFNYYFENIDIYELCSLTDLQIRDFAKKWLNDDQKVNSFLRDIYNSPFIDAAVRPLTIAHLCAIYERVGKIPEKPKTVYKKIVNLLLEEWDEQRNVKRISKYADFEIDRKFEFLTSIAYFLTVSSKRSIFSKSNLESAYYKINEDFGLEKKDSKNVMEELETHTGLFLQSGYEFYEFAHKSLQEYLTAEYIVRLPTIPSESIIRTIPNELAIAISISSNPSQYFIELVFNRLNTKRLNYRFYQIFLTRLIIEKPDFNKSNLVGIAAFQLYSNYLAYNKDMDQLKLFIQDDLILEFENTIKVIFKRNAKNLFQKYYYIVSEESSTNGTKVVTIKKKKNIEFNSEFSDLKNYNLPETLLYRDSFLS
ncbi:NACHT domain-containing protein [Flavobacterium anhuiense]|uniref:NACHT domain-containing protein n=1 Tax=Flavobacterium anhuiense TaxID=459526 RepID=UPI000E6C1015|nr:NACHT domain-containing protein [Flavobacterium anhuiense]